MTPTYLYTVSYLFTELPREYQVELQQEDLTLAQAAVHLLQLHFGDGESSLMMPSADASADEVLRQSGLLGITEIDVARDADPLTL